MDFKRLGSRVALCLAIMVFARGQQVLSPSVGLSKLETKDLELLYYDPIQTYLTPYVAQSYENSLAFQEKTYGWNPYDRPVVLLRDLSDNGGASVRGGAS